jgi:hypothetical protein
MALAPFGMTAAVKELFFDRKLVQREVGKENAKALSKAGAFVRKRARSSMRRRKASSPPGQPPSAHSKDPVASLKNILFAYDPRNMSVVIGPVLLSGKHGSVPALHEFGGVATVRRRGKQVGQATARQVRYPARPFMGPALVAEAPKFPSLWVSSAGGRAA